MRLPSRLRWSRTDNLIAHAVLVVAMAVAGLTGLLGLLWITPLIPSGGGGVVANTVTVPRPEGVPEPSVAVGAASPDVSVAAPPEVVVEFHDPTALERLLLAAPGLLGTAAVLVVLFMVLRLVRSLDRGEPFVAANVRRVYAIAYTVLVGSLAVPVAGAVCDSVLRSRALGADGLVLTAGLLGGRGGISLALVLTGFLLAALAEVFRRGARLREDVEGLV
jgi:hypothetical protein